MKRYGGDSMVAPLGRVMVCGPGAARWCDQDDPGWRSLGYLHAPDAARARREHEQLCRLLRAAGCEVEELPPAPGLTLDAVYAHDASLMTSVGAICLRMGKPARRGEPAAHKSFYEARGIPVAGEVVEPGTVEAGDVVWVNDRVLLTGRGYRTNAQGIRQLQQLVPPAVKVVTAPLPHADGPASCLHLMSLISLLDERTALVDLPWLAVETVELLRDCGYGFVEIEPSERATLACNVLALGHGKLIALAENPRTNDRLRRAGYDVLEFSGGEIGINGGGGPTCLTRPLLRGTALCQAL